MSGNVILGGYFTEMWPKFLFIQDYCGPYKMPLKLRMHWIGILAEYLIFDLYITYNWIHWIQV